MNSNTPTCKILGCNKPCFQKSTGEWFDFCGKSHAQLYAQISLNNSNGNYAPDSVSQGQQNTFLPSNGLQVQLGNPLLYQTPFSFQQQQPLYFGNSSFQQFPHQQQITAFTNMNQSKSTMNSNVFLGRMNQQSITSFGSQTKINSNPAPSPQSQYQQAVPVIQQPSFASVPNFPSMPTKQPSSFITAPSGNNPICKQCNIKNCFFNSSTNSFSDYCSAVCKNLAANTPMQSKVMPNAIMPLKKAKPAVTTPKLTEIPSTDTKYSELEKQFVSKFKTGTVTVLNISQVHVTDTLYDKFDAYRNKIIAKNVPVFGTGSAGNTHRRFHGTGQRCKLGLKGNLDLCSDSGCAVCSIIKSGWLMSYASNGLFGKGIYFTSTSSKSHKYNQNSETGLGQGVRSMFIAHVVIGKAHIYNNFTAVNSPPNGCDSVIGQPGGNIKDDEVIVYNEDAALPLYFIVYKV